MVKQKLKQLSAISVSAITASAFGISGTVFAGSSDWRYKGESDWHSSVDYHHDSDNHQGYDWRNRQEWNSDNNNDDSNDYWWMRHDTNSSGYGGWNNNWNWQHGVMNSGYGGANWYVPNMSQLGNNAGLGSIGLTGPGSTNVIYTTSSTTNTVQNTNHVDVANVTEQHAQSGNADNSMNTIGSPSGASTGNANNTSTNTANVVVTNNVTIPTTSLASSVLGGGRIFLTGPRSTNIIYATFDSTTSVMNTNNVSVGNYANQTATSGSADSSWSTIGGRSVSGSAANTSANLANVMLNNR